MAGNALVASGCTEFMNIEKRVKREAVTPPHCFSSIPANFLVFIAYGGWDDNITMCWCRG